MTTNRSIFAAIALALVPAHNLRAQSVDAQAPAESTDVTQPTRLGIRMTPDMSKAFSRAYLRYSLDMDGGLSGEQEQQLADAVSRTVMTLAHEHARDGRDFFEFTFEHLIRNDGQFDAEQAREYAKRATPLIPAVQGFLQGIDREARRILDDAQYEEFARKVKGKKESYDRFEQKMQRWSQGQVEPNERPFLEPDPTEASATQASGDANQRKLRTAQRRAERDLRRFGPAEWERLSERTQSFFAFSKEQISQANRLLRDARQEAVAIMTSKWRRTFVLNRTKYHVTKTSQRPVAPYRHQLDREYEAFTRPVVEIGRRFEKALFALVSAEQRETATARLQEFAQSHGMTVETDLEALLTVPDGT